MSYAAHHKDFGSFVGHKGSPENEAIARKTGILRRVFDALVESRQRENDREVARFLARSGRAFTDDLEREISRRLMTSNWSANADFNDRRFP